MGKTSKYQQINQGQVGIQHFSLVKDFVMEMSNWPLSEMNILFLVVYCSLEKSNDTKLSSVFRFHFFQFELQELSNSLRQQEIKIKIMPVTC